MAAKSEWHRNNGGFARWHHSLGSNVSAVCHTRWHATITQVHRHVHTKRWTQNTHMLTHYLSLPLSLGTIGVSKCQRSIWKAAVITVKAGHERDATLTLLTCLHQHTWTASLAGQQFSHGASQNNVRCSHTLRSPPPLTMLICCIHTESTKTTCCSHGIKRPSNPGESPYFLLISPVKSTSSLKGRRQKKSGLQKDFQALRRFGWGLWRGCNSILERWS